MKKLTRLIYFVLVLIMMVSLFGCGASNTSTQSSAGNSTKPSASAAASGGTTASASASAAKPSASAAGTAVKTEDYVKRTLGVTSYLGRLVSGLTPVEQYLATDSIFDQIFKPDPVTKKIASWIIEDYQLKDDLTLIMKMKKNIFFNNGDQAKSNDLLYSYTSYKDRGSAFLNAFPMVWEECKTLDDYTVQMKFSQPYPAFFYTQVNLINEKWSKSVGWNSLEWYNHPVGSGPYAVAEYSPDKQIVLKLRDKYWNSDVTGEFYIDEWVIKYFPDQTTMNMELEVGTIDYCSLDNAGYARVKKGVKGVGSILESAGTTVYLNFGMIDKAPVWNEPKLRQAIAYAVNWEDLGKAAYGDRYIPAFSIATSQCPYYVNPGKYEYNPEKAKKLLAECGYTASKPLTLTTTLMETDKTIAEPFQFYLQQVGIVVNLKFADTATAVEIWRSKKGNDFAFWFAHRGSPFHELRASIPYTQSGYQSFNYIDDAKFQDLFDKMTHTYDQDAIAKYGKELQKYNFDNFFILPVCELPYTIGYRTDKFTDAQIRKCILSTNLLQTSRLGMLSTWK